MELSGSTRISIYLFLLIYGLTICTAQAEKGIDWSRCQTPPYEYDAPTKRPDTVCLVKESCVDNAPDDTSEKILKLYEKGKALKCGTGVQIKPYSNFKWIVYLQVEKPKINGIAEPLLPNEGVWITKNDIKLFGCQKNAEGVKYEANNGITIKKHESEQEVMSDDNMFCVFSITSITPLPDYKNIDRAHPTLFEFQSNPTGKFKIPISIWDSAKDKATCDRDLAKFPKDYPNPELLIRQIAITREDDNNCAEGEFLYTVDAGGTKLERIQNLHCKYTKNPTNDDFLPPYAYAYKVVGETEERSFSRTGIFNIFCGTKACTKCGDLPNTPNGKAVTPTGSGQDTCREVKCENDLWDYEHTNGNKGITIANITCEKFSDKAAWVMDFKGDDGNVAKVEVAKAGCTEKIDCFSKSFPLLGCPPNITTKCGAVNVTKKNSDPFSCPIGTLTVVKRGLTEIETISGPIECNYTTGNWKADFDSGKINQAISAGSRMYCNETSKEGQKGGQISVTSAQMAWYLSGGAFVAIILIIAGVIGGMKIRRHRKYSPSEREMRKRPKGKGIHRVFPEKLCVEDLAQVKDWPDALFDQILAQWLKFSVYERSKFAERIGFELGVTSSCQHYFKLFTRIFEVEVDYRVWQNVVPTFKLLHAQAVDKENNLDTDKRMRKWCIAQCKPILERVGWEGCNNEWRDTAYIRYQVFNLLYYCEDKDFTEKLLEFFDKGQFHGLHSLNRQIAWAAAVRDKDQFEGAKKCAEDAVVDKNAKREIAARRAKATAASSGGWTKTKTQSEASGASAKSSKSNKGGASGKDKKAVGSKEAKSSASKEGSKSNRSNKSNKSGKDKKDKDKKGSKETPSGKGKKGDSKEASKSGKSGRSGKDKKEKGGSKEEGKGKSKEKPREKAGGEGDSGNDKKEPPSSDNDKKKDKSGKDKKDSSKEKKTISGKDKKTTSGKDKKTTSEKDKKTTSGKDKKSSKENKSNKDKKSEKTCPSTKSGKSSKEKKSSKSSKEPKTMTAIDKSSKSAKSGKSKKTTASMKRRRGAAIGFKERRDADGGKLHGDRAQHIFFAIGSSRSKEQIAAFLDWYIECNEYDPSNLVYLFAATLEWDDTRCYGLDLFVNMNKKAFIKMPPGDKYHMRIMKNFRKYDHLVRDPNYSAKHFGQINSELMLKRIHNNVTFQPRMIDDLDEALKKLNF